MRMEETTEGAAQEGSTLSGTPSETPAADAGVYQQNTPVVYASKSPVPIIIGAIYSLFQVIMLLGSLAIVLGGALLAGFASEIGEGAAEGGFLLTLLGLVALTLSAIGIYAGVLMIQYKKKGINIALGLLVLGYVLNIPMNMAMDLPAFDGMGFSLVTNGLCGALVAIPLLVSSISEQMD